MNGTAHPRRYAKACDACYKKKIKCVYKEPACELCTKNGQQCRFTRVEKMLPKRPRRGKYLSALEDRMNEMESLLQRSQENQSRPKRQPIREKIEHSISNESPGTEDSSQTPDTSSHVAELHFPPKEQALRLSQGYFASSNHIMPILSRDVFMQRLKGDYPPDKTGDLVWWSSICAVLCYAHRLRAMSNPAEADTENNEACRYLRELLEVAPKLSYGSASVASAQVLLAIASIFRGTPMPDPAPMLVAVAIRMLQTIDVHKEEVLDSPHSPMRKERERVFWVAYILDKDIALTTRKPPVLSEMNIGRPPLPDREEDDVGTVKSLDGYSEANLFTISQRLAAIQGRVWDRVYSVGAIADRSSLLTAEDDLNPVLAAWKCDLPFGCRRDDLIGRWPKHAIVHIVVLHFRYFYTLVVLNKEPAMEKGEPNPLDGDCPVAKSLPSYPHSTAMVAVEAARDALDLASLTPRGNFQNVWLFLDFSICAVLTLLANGIVRPLNDQATDDLRRVDTWIRVIDILATTSERADLLEKKQFLVQMRGWTVRVLENAFTGRETECIGSQPRVYLDAVGAGSNGGEDEPWSFPDIANLHPDVFPLEQLYTDQTREGWDSAVMAWPYFGMPTTFKQ